MTEASRPRIPPRVAAMELKRWTNGRIRLYRAPGLRCTPEGRRAAGPRSPCFFPVRYRCIAARCGARGPRENKHLAKRRGAAPFPGAPPGAPPVAGKEKESEISFLYCSSLHLRQHRSTEVLNASRHLPRPSRGAIFLFRVDRALAPAAIAAPAAMV